MASLVDEEKKLFPLVRVSSVVSLFRSVLHRTCEPDLALFSIIIGYIENTLTNSHQILSAANSKSLTIQINSDLVDEIDQHNHLVISDAQSTTMDYFPAVELNVVEALLAKFRAVIKSSVDLHSYGSPQYATREIVKKVSDVIWNTLTRSYYKDRAHLSSIYNYLTGKYNNINRVFLVLFILICSTMNVVREQIGLFRGCTSSCCRMPSVVIQRCQFIVIRRSLLDFFWSRRCQGNGRSDVAR